MFNLSKALSSSWYSSSPLFCGIISGFFSSRLSTLSFKSLFSGFILPLSLPAPPPCLDEEEESPTSSKSLSSWSGPWRRRITMTMIIATRTNADTTPIRAPRIGVIWRRTGVEAEKKNMVYLGMLEEAMEFVWLLFYTGRCWLNWFLGSKLMITKYGRVNKYL